MIATIKILFILAAFRSCIDAGYNAENGKSGMAVVGCVMFFLFAFAAAFITGATFSL